MAAKARRKSDKAPVRVAIVGGGCAGLAAAWQLSKYPGFELDVYEASWRLGGKGASGRDREGRIQEHGLHIWLGFYENAFRMMRECYAEVQKQKWGPRSKIKLAHRSVEEAFAPEPHIGVLIPDSAEESSDDPGKKWEAWSGFLPPAPGLPGEELDEETNPFTLSSYLLRCIELLKTLMLSVVGPPDEPVPGRPRPDHRSKLDEAIEGDFTFDPLSSPEVLLDWMVRYLRGGALTTAAGVLQGVTILEDWLHKVNLSPQVPNTPLRFMEALAAQIRKQLRELVGIDKRVRWKTEVIDIVLTIAVGLFKDRILFEDRGLDALNHIDYREWLRQHGATKTALESRFLSGIYDLTFAYRDGDRKKPELAAGVALRGALRMFFTYRGSMFWRMRSGMGDAVFAPLYRALMVPDRKTKDINGKEITASPVRFHFRHKLCKAQFDFRKDGCYLTDLEFTTTGDRETLDELSRAGAALDHFGCWPDDARQFTSAGDKETSVPLKAGKHFDAVIFATGLSDFEATCEGSGFFAHMPKWNAMRSAVKTVATQAAQVWMERNLDQLGWRRGPGVFTGFEQPFETWADMTHTLASEKAWRDAGNGKNGKAAPDKTRSIAYFCSVLADAEVERLKGRSGEKDNEQLKHAIRAEIEKKLDYLLQRGIRPLWPTAFRHGETAQNYELHRFVRANVAGSDRYTLSLPGSIEHRISPLDHSVLNMTVAGDWTASGLDAGCVEGAVMSGMLAALAIAGPRREVIRKTVIGWVHP